jgi:hypothetical protein
MKPLHGGRSTRRRTRRRLNLPHRRHREGRTRQALARRLERAQQHGDRCAQCEGQPEGADALGQPKGPEVPWFFTTTIGKRSYANTVLAPQAELKSPPFHKEGAFAEWQKEKNKRYFIFRYTIEGDKLVVDGGNQKVVEDLMAAEKFKLNATHVFETPATWFARYLEKLYDGSNAATYTRLKK